MRYDPDRMKRVQTPVIPIVGDWIAKHPGTISLGQGVVHYGPPSEVARAVVDAVNNESRIDRYGMVCGNDDLLAAITEKARRENHIVLGSGQAIVTTPGSNMGFVNAVLATADVEDEIILIGPYYFNHEMAVVLAGCRPVIVESDTRYQLDLASIEQAITRRTRAIVTVSPNNPTGAVYSAASLVSVNQLCAKHHIYHIHDEAYEYFVYEGHEHYSPASRPGSEPHTISLFSLSKAYGMAGWRIGYMILPAALELSVKKIQDTNLVCPPIISQIAGRAALQVGVGWCREKIGQFQQIRDMIVDELGTLGDACEVPTPDGAFYALLRLDTTKSDMTIVEELIRQFGVALLPGSTFGVCGGCSVRVAYGALDRATVAEGIGRLVTGLRALL